MAEMVCSALVQETVSRGVSFALGRREEKASQGHLTERLEMAVSELEFALERAMELPIRHLSLLQRRKIIKRAYVEAMELLDKHKQQAVPPGPGQEEELPTHPQAVNKRKRWFNCATNKKNMSIIAPSSFAGLSTDVVGRFEWYADCARRFVRDLESGCSLHHYTFCSPIVRHLLEGKALSDHWEQGNLLRHLYIRPMYSDERGVEALLSYRYEDSTVAEKCFFVALILRLTESTDLVGIAIKGLQFLASTQFKPAVEYAIGEFTLLSNLQADISHLPWVGAQEWYTKHTQVARPDPACCKGSRHGLCANSNSASSELADIFPDQIIALGFQCYISALESKTRSSSESSHQCGRRSSSKNRGWKPPLVLTAAFMPHAVTQNQTQDSLLEIIGDATNYRNASSIQQVVETIQSAAANCFSRQPELAKYVMDWSGKHGHAWFVVKSSSETALDFSNMLQRCGCCPEKILHGYNSWREFLCASAWSEKQKNCWREKITPPPTATAEKGEPSRASTTRASARRSRMRH